MKNNKISLKDMAERLQVSTATISNAFNHPDQLSETLRQHILQECYKVGYRGGCGTRRRQRGGAKVVALVVPDSLTRTLTDVLWLPFHSIFASMLETHNRSLLLLPSNLIRDVSGLKNFEDLVESFVFYGIAPQDEVGKRLKLLRKGVVLVNCELSGYESLRLDYGNGTRLAVMHGLASAEGPIAILAAGLLDTDRVCRLREGELDILGESPALQKLHGCRVAIQDMGRSISADRIWHLPDSNFENAYQAAHEALGCYMRPSLVLCMDDVIARATMRVADELKLAVPDDLRVVSLAALSLTPTDNNDLTTVDWPAKRLGQLVAQRVLGHSDDEDSLLSGQLSFGDSCP